MCVSLFDRNLWAIEEIGDSFDRWKIVVVVTDLNKKDGRSYAHQGIEQRWEGEVGEQEHCSFT